MRIFFAQNICRNNAPEISLYKLHIKENLGSTVTNQTLQAQNKISVYVNFGSSSTKVDPHQSEK